jgi:hypothetical protein
MGAWRKRGRRDWTKVSARCLPFKRAIRPDRNFPIPSTHTRTLFPRPGLPKGEKRCEVRARKKPSKPKPGPPTHLEGMIFDSRPTTIRMCRPRSWISGPSEYHRPRSPISSLHVCMYVCMYTMQCVGCRCGLSMVRTPRTGYRTGLPRFAMAMPRISMV